MSVRTSAGSTIALSASQPVNYDVAGYSALSYFNIGEVTDIGEFGREHALVIHNPTANRGTVKRKGSFNEGTMDMKVGLDTDDSGQIIAKSASMSDNDFSFKVTLQSGDIYYFQAQVMSFKINIGGVDNITTASIKLELTGAGIVEALSLDGTPVVGIAAETDVALALGGASDLVAGIAAETDAALALGSALASAALKFNVATNSQYIPIVAF